MPKITVAGGPSDARADDPETVAVQPQERPGEGRPSAEKRSSSDDGKYTPTKSRRKSGS